MYYTQFFVYAIIRSATNRVKMLSFPILTDELVPNIKKIAYNKIYVQKNIKKQVRTNIGLADTLIPSSFIYLIYMEGIGPCDSIKIIFGYLVNS